MGTSIPSIAAGCDIEYLIDSTVEVRCIDGWKSAKFLGITAVDTGDVHAVVRISGDVDCAIVNPTKIKFSDTSKWKGEAATAREMLDAYLSKHSVVVLFGISRELQNWAIVPSAQDRDAGTVSMITIVGVLELAKHAMIHEHSYDEDEI